MTRAELRKLARSHSAENGTDWLSDSTSGDYLTLDDYVTLAYDQYAIETECFRVNYTLAATIGTGVYPFSAFDAYTTVTATHTAAAPLPADRFTSVAAHGLIEGDIVVFDTTNGTTLIAGQEYFVKYYSSTVFQVASTRGGTAIVIADHTNHVKKPAAARMFKASYMAFNSVDLDHITPARLENIRSNWRFDSNGVPRWWFKWNEGGIRVHPAPSTTANIYIEGFETPDRVRFDEDNDSPAIHPGDHSLLAIYAAILTTVRDPSNENAIRSNVLFPAWQEGTVRARSRIHGPDGAEVIVARQAGLRKRPDMSHYETITRII